MKSAAFWFLDRKQLRPNVQLFDRIVEIRYSNIGMKQKDR